MATRLLALLVKQTDEGAESEIVAALGETRRPTCRCSHSEAAQSSNDSLLCSAIHALAAIKSDQAIAGSFNSWSGITRRLSGLASHQSSRFRN